MRARLLLVEDDRDIAETLTDLLKSEGHEVETSHDGRQGLSMATEQHYDLLLLDVMLPGIDGFEICQAIRKQGFHGGILMLTARGLTDDRVRGLRTGADDYLVKPWEPKELLARVEALLRRTKKDVTPSESFAVCGKLRANFTAMIFERDGEDVRIAGKEAELLRCLNDHEGQLLSREQLLSEVWSDQPHITKRTVDVHIAWLRQKVEEDPHRPHHIQTIRGKGYRFVR